MSDQREQLRPRLNGEVLNAAQARYAATQSSAENNDAVLWQATAIIWGANVVMLGFAFAADKQAGCVSQGWMPQARIIAASILGGLLTWFANRNYNIMRTARNLKYDICQRLEEEMGFGDRFDTHRDQKRIYPAGVQTFWHNLITGAFLLAWGMNLAFAIAQLAAHHR